MRMTKLVLGAAMAVCAMGATSSAVAQDTIALRVADSFPVGHFIPRYLILPWIERVTAATNGRVKFQYYPAEQLGKAKDLLALAQNGVMDIAYVVPAFVSDKMPLSGVVELPGQFSSSCTGTLAYFKLAREGKLAEREFAPNGVRLLFVLVNPPYQILTKQKLTTLDNLKGQKLRTAGGAMDIMATKLGVVPVRLPGPDIYESLSRGTLDGLVFPLPNVMEYHLETKLKYATRSENFGSFVHNFMISEKKWKQLPEDVQKVMLKVGEEMTREACQKIDADLTPAVAKLQAAGITFVDLGSADKARLKKELADVGTEWAGKLDARGLAGTETLKAYGAALQAVK